MTVPSAMSFSEKQGTRDGVSIIGAGGHAKVVIGTLQDGGYRVHRVYDDSPTKHGTTILGQPVVGSVSALQLKDVASAIVAIGDNRTRATLAARLALNRK